MSESFRDRFRPRITRPKEFNLQLLERVEITSEDHLLGGRSYYLPDGTSFPSVTTVLSRIKGSDPKWKSSWMGRVGVQEAIRQTEMAKTRGNAVHALCEGYLKGEEKWLDGAMPLNINLFLQAKSLLDRVSVIRGIELPLYSRVLNAAGRCDLLGIMDHKLSIMDFKTNGNGKLTKDTRSKYLLQAAAYAFMVEEIYRMPCEHLMIVVMVEDEDKPVVIESSLSEQRDSLINAFTE